MSDSIELDGTGTNEGLWNRASSFVSRRFRLKRRFKPTRKSVPSVLRGDSIKSLDTEISKDSIKSRDTDIMEAFNPKEGNEIAKKGEKDKALEEYNDTKVAKQHEAQSMALPWTESTRLEMGEYEKAYKILENLINAIQTAESNQKKCLRFSPMRMVYFIWKKFNKNRLQRLVRKNNIPVETLESLKTTANSTELEAPAPPPRVSQQQLAREEDTESIVEIKKMGKLYVEDSFAYTAYEGRSAADTIADKIKRGQLKLEGEVYDGVAGKNKAGNGIEGGKKRKVKVKRKVRKKKNSKNTQSQQHFQSETESPNNVLFSKGYYENNKERFQKLTTPMNVDTAPPIPLRPKSMKQKTIEKSGDRRKSLG